MDALAEKYSAISPFTYVINNPIRLIDPDGRYIVDENGRAVRVKKDKETGVITYSLSKRQIKKGNTISAGTKEYLDALNENEDGRAIISTLDEDSKAHKLVVSDKVGIDVEDGKGTVLRGVTLTNASDGARTHIVFTGTREGNKREKISNGNFIAVTDFTKGLKKGGSGIVNLTQEEVNKLVFNQNVDKTKANNSKTDESLRSVVPALDKFRAASRANFIRIVGFHEAAHGAHPSEKEPQTKDRERKYFRDNYLKND